MLVAVARMRRVREDLAGRARALVEAVQHTFERLLCDRLLGSAFPPPAMREAPSPSLPSTSSANGPRGYGDQEPRYYLHPALPWWSSTTEFVCSGALSKRALLEEAVLPSIGENRALQRLFVEYSDSLAAVRSATDLSH